MALRKALKSMDPELVSYCQMLLAAAWLLRLEGNHPAAQEIEREARELSGPATGPSTNRENSGTVSS